MVYPLSSLYIVNLLFLSVYMYIRYIMIDCQTFQVIKYHKEAVLKLFISGKRLLDSSALQFSLNERFSSIQRFIAVEYCNIQKS